METTEDESVSKPENGEKNENLDTSIQQNESDESSQSKEMEKIPVKNIESENTESDNAKTETIVKKDDDAEEIVDRLANKVKVEEEKMEEEAKISSNEEKVESTNMKEEVEEKESESPPRPTSHASAEKSPPAAKVSPPKVESAAFDSDDDDLDDDDEDDDELDDDDDDDGNNDPYSFSEDEEGFSPKNFAPGNKKQKSRNKIKMEDSDDDRPCSSGSLGEEDRLVIAEDDGVMKKESGGYHENSYKLDFTEKRDGKLKQRKKQNRFNGLTEEELAKRLLPDSIVPDLDILIIGINPGMYAAYKGHHYAGPGNHFWKCMYLSGLLPRPMCADDDQKLIEFGIGFTNIVERTTRGSAQLTRQEIVEGSQKLLEKIKTYKPKIAVFNGKGIFEVFSGQKSFPFGKQPEKLDGTETYVWVMPNSSARCAQLPRAIDKVPFFTALKKFRDYLNGKIKEEDFKEEEVVFSEVKLKNFSPSPEKKSKMMTSSELKFADDLDLDSKGESQVDPVTGKKRRGRPPKPRPDGSVPPPKRRRVDADGIPMPRGTNPIDPLTGKKKRGRPKKTDCPEGSTPTSTPKEGKRMSKKAAKLLANGFDKRASTESGEFFSGGASYPGGNGDVDDTSGSESKPVVPPLPPFSPNFRRASMNPADMAMDEATAASTEAKISPKPEEDVCSQQQRSLPPPHSLQPSHAVDYGRSVMSMESTGSARNRSSGSDSMDNDDELRRRQKYQQQYGDYSRQSEAEQQQQDLHLQQRHHAQQQQYNSPSRFLNYSPSPVSSGSSKASVSGQPRTPTHSYSPGNGSYGYANGAGSVHHPAATQYDRATHKSSGGQAPEDVAAKSITGLASLVEQIPASMSENDSGIYSSSGAGSHPNTPRSVGPYSPAAGQQFHASPFHPSSAAAAGFVSASQNHFVPSTSDSFSSDHSSTNYSSGPSSLGPTDFSVNSLVHSGGSSSSAAAAAAAAAAASSSLSTAVSEAAAAASLAAVSSPHFSVSDSFSVSSLTSSYDMASKYSGLPSAAAGNPYMQPGMFGSSAASFGGGIFGQGIGSAAGSFMNPGSMANAMGMGAAMSYYGSYPNTYGSAASAAAQTPGFVPSPYAHGLHMPNPSYPYAYGQSPYSQYF